MTLTPTELETMGEAADLLDALLAAAGVYMTETQKTRAVCEIDHRLNELRQRWQPPLDAVATTGGKATVATRAPHQPAAQERVRYRHGLAWQLRQLEKAGRV